MLKKYKNLYLGIMIPANIIFYVSLICVILIIVLQREFLEFFVSVSVFSLSGFCLLFFPAILEEKIIKNLFPINKERVRICIKQEKLRKDYDVLSEKAKEIFQISLNEEGAATYLLKYDVDKEENRYRLYVKSKYSSCIIYDSQKNPNCKWLLKYSKYIEVN